MLQEVALQDVSQAAQRPLLQALLQVIICQPATAQICVDATLILWALGCSNSGMEVEVMQPQTPPPADSDSVGVLVLGFAGANMGMLKLHMRTYQQLHPTWRVVATTGCLLELLNATDAVTKRGEQLMADHLAEIERSLAGCRRLVVHSMSNNGQVLWLRLLRKAPAFVERVCAMVFDCGAARSAAFTDRDLHMVLRGTILASAFLNELAWSPPKGSSEKQLGVLIDDALANAVQRHRQGTFTMFVPDGAIYDTGGLDESSWQAANDPAVPTLVLTSDGDEVVPPQAVRSFAELLASTQPTRSVRVETLRGAHVRLLNQGRGGGLLKHD